MTLSLPIHGPHRDESAEQAILCALLNRPQHVATLSNGLPQEHFYHPGNRLLFAHLIAMAAEGSDISLPTLTKRLMQAGDLDKIGGSAEIVHLMTHQSTPIDPVVTQCKASLKDAWLSRSAMTLMNEAIAEGQAAGCVDPAAWIMATAEKLQALGQEALPRHRSMKELVVAAVERYEEASRRHGQLQGVSTGFDMLDAMTGGLVAGHLWVIGGGTSDGKSAYVQQIMLAAGIAGAPVAIYTLEMSDDENVDRFFAQHACISSESFLKGTFTNEDARAFSRASNVLSNLPIHIRDVSGIKKTELLADMRMLWRIYNIKVFAIDYGQLIGSEGKQFSREREVADFSASLKAFAKQTKSTVIFVSQLNEDGLLRESRAIGFDADKAMRLRVPVSNEGIADDSRRYLHLDKNRGGKRYQKIEYDFDGATFRFINERKPSDETPAKKRP